jgi:hypothetical protein
LQKQDLANSLLNKYNDRDWVFDTIRMVAQYALTGFGFKEVSRIYNVFAGIGICQSLKVRSKYDINRLLKYYLVRYKPNEKGDMGLNIEGSLNYVFREYAKKILEESSFMQQEVQPLVQSFRENGLTNDIDIIVALDTTLNKGLIVDGTKRSLTLYYMLHKEKQLFNEVLTSAKSINIVYLKSAVCRILFPLDFCKLSSPNTIF